METAFPGHRMARHGVDAYASMGNDGAEWRPQRGRVYPHPTPIIPVYMVVPPSSTHGTPPTLRWPRVASGNELPPHTPRFIGGSFEKVVV